jgi:hypothetical protein
VNPIGSCSFLKKLIFLRPVSKKKFTAISSKKGNQTKIISITQGKKS